MAKEILSKRGNCYQCGITLGKRAMQNHIIKEHNTSEAGEDCYLLKIESTEYADFWLYADIPKTKKLEYIDKFLQGIWLKCCGHMSRFASDSDGRNEIPKSRKLEKFNVGDELFYDYDFGSTTYVDITIIGETTRPKQQASVRLLARNISPAFDCSECKKNPATHICTECMYEDETVGSLSSISEVNLTLTTSFCTLSPRGLRSSASACRCPEFPSRF